MSSKQASLIQTVIFICILSSMMLCSCNRIESPKPKGYFRITFPEKAYEQYDTNLPYKFEKPIYSIVKKDHSRLVEPYWINLMFPKYKVQLHISYKPIEGNLEEILEDTRKLAYKHTIKADALQESLFLDNEKHVYGILYDIAGNAASPLQFFLTDSTKHFLRGSLYFNVVPNKDSLAPVIDFIHPDIIHLIESFEWKDID